MMQSFKSFLDVSKNQQNKFESDLKHVIAMKISQSYWNWFELNESDKMVVYCFLLAKWLQNKKKSSFRKSSQSFNRAVNGVSVPNVLIA